MADLTCDVAVIGAGTAGIAAERSARTLGAKTILIDPEFAGTVCATVGCMPSKLLIAAARRADAVRKAGMFGIGASLDIDGPAVMKRVREERDRFAAATRAGFDSLPDGTCVRGRARFISENELALDDGRIVRAAKIVVATGSSPLVPKPFHDIDPSRVLTNRSVFELPDLPKSLAVIGSGPIGIELAQAFGRLGTRVVVFDRDDRIGAIREAAMHECAMRVLSKDVDFKLGTDPQPSQQEDAVRIEWEGGFDAFDFVLVATGRPPSLEGLDLENAGLALDENGMPDVDPHTLQCGDSAVFLVGDANGDRPFLQEAADEGSRAGRTAAKGPDVVHSDRPVPFNITFTEPPIVSIGQGPSDGIVTGCSDYADQGRARVEGQNDGQAFVHGRIGTGKITGADLFCPGGEHLGHLLAWAMTEGASASDLLSRPFYHPTLEEGLKSALNDIRKACEPEQTDEQHLGDLPGL